LWAPLVLDKLEEAKQAANANKKLKEKEEEYEELQKENVCLKSKLDVTECKLKSTQVLSNYYKKENSRKEIYKLKKIDGELNNKADPMKYLCASVAKNCRNDPTRQTCP
jgi:predicted nuclease with TOPRIM domain